jgi:DNA-binding transcriptional MerR regulator
MATWGSEAMTVDMSMRPRDGGLLTEGEELSRHDSESIAWAADAIRDQGMPSEEIDAILGADDPELVRRYFELHRERLDERLADQRRALARLEQLLAARSIGAAARSQEKEVAGR